jgi:3-oxosteroid 1-dehydrogenase
MTSEFDVVVVGSGAAGILAGIRAADLGLEAVVLEKAHAYGGTSATSGGGMWMPNHKLEGHQDTPEQALQYLQAVTGGVVPEPRLRAFVDNAPRVISYFSEMGIGFEVQKALPDYSPELPGSVPGRTMFFRELDGGELGSDYLLMREPFFQALMLGRYSTDVREAAALVRRSRGWRLVAAKIILRYWLDFGQRARGPRDRRATRGAALVGTLRRELRRRNVALQLNSALQELVVEDGRVTGVVVSSDGRLRTIKARRGVILAAGGWEHNQAIRDENLPVKTQTVSSLSPAGGNTGDALKAGIAIGAATEFMDCMWWAPVLHLPLEGRNREIPYSLTNDQRHPNSIMVNRAGERFVNENCSYDEFGIAMVADQQKSGANVPCWLIFDGAFRDKYMCGPIMPNDLMPDRKIPGHWWDQYLYRAGSVAELAAKIGVPEDRLEHTVARFNADAAVGEDTQFGRGKSAYDHHWGDPDVKPNPCLGPIDRAPFYAVRVDLGDLGAKGGLKADANAQVMSREGRPIQGLYAVGNCSGCAFGNAYPGGGGTLGPAVTFAFVAVNHLAAAANTAPARRLETAS